MELKIFFEPVSPQLFKGIKDIGCLYHAMNVHHEQFPPLEGLQIALIGLNEGRGMKDSLGTVVSDDFREAADGIRAKLYRLQKGTGNLKIADFGNLKNAPTYEETLERIKEVGKTLMDVNIVPVFIGGTHDLDYGQYQAYEEMEKLITVLGVDNRFDMMEEVKTTEKQLFRNEDKKHLYHILKHEPNYLFQYIHLGYQTYLVNQAHLELMDRLHFDYIRVGNIQEDIKEVEPMVRDADMLSFDIGALSAKDAVAQPYPEPFGLTGQEACQIAWYAGLNEKLSSIGFYNYLPINDCQNKQTAQTVAVMIWHFIEGFYQRRDDLSFKSNDYLKYKCNVGGNPETIDFYKSKLTGKWWMEIPLSGEGRSALIPCSYEEYKKAGNGEIPDKYIQATLRHS